MRRKEPEPARLLPRLPGRHLPPGPPCASAAFSGHQDLPADAGLGSTARGKSQPFPAAGSAAPPVRTQNGKDARLRACFTLNAPPTSPFSGFSNWRVRGVYCASVRTTTPSALVKAVYSGDLVSAMCTFQLVKMFKLFQDLLLLRNEIVYTKYEGWNSQKEMDEIGTYYRFRNWKVKVCAVRDDRASEKANSNVSCNVEAIRPENLQNTQSPVSSY